VSLHHYDTYVPLVPEIQTRFTFDEAIEMVLDALAPLGKEYVQVLAEGLRSRRWCDRYENKANAAAPFPPAVTMRRLTFCMNYKQDVFADVYTLAHEAGHSMHSWFSQNSQLFQDYEYPIFLAKSHRRLTRNCLRIICFRQRAIQRCGLHHQPRNRRSARHVISADDVC